MAKPRFVVYENSGWCWRLVDGNNENIAASERYASKANAVRGAQNVKSTAPDANIETEEGRALSPTTCGYSLGVRD
jgi:uncharacterized protein YegP (UPF0339 family)